MARPTSPGSRRPAEIARFDLGPRAGTAGSRPWPPKVLNSPRAETHLRHEAQERRRRPHRRSPSLTEATERSCGLRRRGSSSSMVTPVWRVHPGRESRLFDLGLLVPTMRETGERRRVSRLGWGLGSRTPRDEPWVEPAG